jgi:ATP-dependent DNA helicase RecG
MMSISDLLTTNEGKTLEFKKDLSSPRNILRSLVAFANTAGGRIVIGVDDRTRKPSGVEHPLDEEERLCNLIADSIRPRLVPNIEITTHAGKTLLIAEVYPSSSRPHYVNAEGPDTGVYVRLGSTNRQADRELIAELRRSAEGIGYDQMPMVDLSIDDLDLDAARRAFGDNKSLDMQALLSLKLITTHQNRHVPTIGGFLLFGKNRTYHYPDAWVQCGRFLGTEKLDIFDHIDINTSLPATVNEVMLFLKKHAYRGADLSDIRRKDVWSIPISILREVIINAIVHSDYSQRGAPIRVIFLDDRIEVESMGILVPGLTIDEMKQGASRIRNQVIARVFRELNLIEQWGTGVRRIFSEARELGLAEPKIEEIAMRLRFTVYLRQRHELVSDSISGKVTDPVTDLVADSVARLLLELDLGEKSTIQLLEALHLKHRPTFRSNYLHPALVDGFIERTIPDKPNSSKQRYRLTSKGRQALNKKFM